jgi:hypothetical protein
VDCRPHLHTVGDAFPRLAAALGVPEEFDQRALVGMLERMHEVQGGGVRTTSAHGNDGQGHASGGGRPATSVAVASSRTDVNHDGGGAASASASDGSASASDGGAAPANGSDSDVLGSPLDERQLRLAVAVLGRIGDLGQLPPDVDVLIPDANGVLRRASNLVYNDSAWAPPAQCVLVFIFVAVVVSADGWVDGGGGGVGG